MQGYDHSYVTRLKQADRLVMVRGKVDVAASRKLLEDTADSRYAPQRKEFKQPENNDEDDSASLNLQRSRAVKENYLARMAKLNFERESGKLVEADEVKMFAADLGATFRAALEILPDRISADLVSLDDTDAIRAVLIEEFEQVLMDISAKIDKGIK